jgi:hypothetical protein
MDLWPPYLYHHHLDRFNGDNLFFKGSGVFSNVVRARDAARNDKDVAIKVRIELSLNPEENR